MQLGPSYLPLPPPPRSLKKSGNVWLEASPPVMTAAPGAQAYQPPRQASSPAPPRPASGWRPCSVLLGPLSVCSTALDHGSIEPTRTRARGIVYKDTVSVTCFPRAKIWGKCCFYIKTNPGMLRSRYLHGFWDWVQVLGPSTRVLGGERGGGGWWLSELTSALGPGSWHLPRAQMP